MAYEKSLIDHYNDLQIKDDIIRKYNIPPLNELIKYDSEFSPYIEDFLQKGKVNARINGKEAIIITSEESKGLLYGKLQLDTDSGNPISLSLTISPKQRYVIALYDNLDSKWKCYGDVKYFRIINEYNKEGELSPSSEVKITYSEVLQILSQKYGVPTDKITIIEE